MEYYAEQGEDDRFWYVRRDTERSRPHDCRSAVCVLIADEWPDRGKKAAAAIANVFNLALKPTQPQSTI